MWAGVRAVRGAAAGRPVGAHCPVGVGLMGAGRAGARVAAGAAAPAVVPVAGLHPATAGLAAAAGPRQASVVWTIRSPYQNVSSNREYTPNTPTATGMSATTARPSMRSASCRALALVWGGGW